MRFRWIGFQPGAAGILASNVWRTFRRLRALMMLVPMLFNRNLLSGRFLIKGDYQNAR